MSTGEGPSARNTCAMRCSARIQASGAQITPYQGAPTIPTQDTTAQSVPSISAQDTSTVSALSSVPTQIFTSREAPAVREGRSSARTQNPIRAPHSGSIPTPITRTQSDQSRVEAASTRQELRYLQGRMTDLYNRSDEMLDAMNGIQELARHLHAKELEYPPVKKEEESPRALASQALYADRGPTEDSAEYEQCQRAQVRFGKRPLPSTQERDKNETPTTHQRDKGVENAQSI